MDAKDYKKNTTIKRFLLEAAKMITKECDYDYYSKLTFDCKETMKKIQETWKQTGSAGNQEKFLWNQFKTVQDIFWKKIKLMNKEMKIIELSEESASLHDDFEIALYNHQSGKANHLSELYEQKEDKITELSYEVTSLEDELEILQKKMNLM